MVLLDAFDFLGLLGSLLRRFLGLFGRFLRRLLGRFSGHSGLNGLSLPRDGDGKHAILLEGGLH